MPRPQQHLREIAEAAPEPNGTAVIAPIIESGLRLANERERARRTAERGTADKTNPHVSDAGKCARKVVLSLMNIPESDPLDFDSLLRFKLGHAYEDAIAEILESYQGASYIREERVEIPAGETKITGRRDFDAVRLSLDEETLIELKSSNARAVGFLVKRGAPNEDHVKQANLYLHATGRKKAYLVYLVTGSTKGEPVLHAWRVDYDRAGAEADIAALAEADRNAKARRVPSIPTGYTRNAFPCGYCSYKGLCFDNSEVALINQLAASIGRGEIANA